MISRHVVYFLALLAVLLLDGTALAATWSLRAGDADGLPRLSRNGGDVLTGQFAFWGKNWQWADTPLAMRTNAAFDYTLTGSTKALGLEMTGAIGKRSAREMTWTFDLMARNDIREAIGGGMIFKFNLAAARDEMGDPELLPGHRGWAWGKRGSRIEMRFEPALATIFFEQGNKGEIRAYFYSGSVPRGQKQIRATVTVTSDITLSPTLNERFGLADTDTWPKNILDWDAAPVDLSFLNQAEKPAGKRGFVRARGDRLEFADGTPARFWGTNLTAAALFGTPREAVRRQARRLSELGFNLVRLHHHDSWWVDPNIFGKGATDTRTLNAEALDRLDWWIKCLKDEGIYVWLDLSVQRAFRPGDDIDGFDEIARGQNKVELKGYNYVNLSMQQAMKRFNEAYLGHVNTYTGLAYKDEPAIAALLVTNENDLTTHFGHNMLPDKGVPLHNRLYMAEARAFAKRADLPPDSVWQSWQPGPAKLFLNDLEYRFGTDMIRHLRGLGVKVPIATTSLWGSDPLFSLPALTAGDVIDVHSYGGTLEIERNPLLAANLVDWMAAGHVAGMPMTVTEWNVEKFPSPDRHTIPIYVAAAASHQGWDAMMQYAYAQIPLSGAGYPSNWHAYNDPALIATLPAAALLYRRGDVREASSTYVYRPSKEQLFYRDVSASNSPALRVAAERGKLLIAMPETEELPWLEPTRIPRQARILSDPNQVLIPDDAREIRSDSGELLRNWEEGIFSVNTRHTQAAMGWLGGKTVTLPDLEIRLTTRNATVAVQSLDELPISQSRDILVSLGARALPGGGNSMPFHAEPVEGRISIQDAKGLKLYRRGSGGQLKSIPFTFANGRYVIDLNKTLGTYWLFLKRPSSPTTRTSDTPTS